MQEEVQEFPSVVTRVKVKLLLHKLPAKTETVCALVAPGMVALPEIDHA